MSIDSVWEADGDVNSAQTHEVEELCITPQEPMRVAGEETPDEVGDETERFKQAANAAVESNPESGEECDTEMQAGDSFGAPESGSEVSSDDDSDD